MIKEYIKTRKSTLLCSGPMSKNCIDASIELSKDYDIPQVLIASRRQIDASDFGGGYVENFSTEAFSHYVKSKKQPKVFLARDHGGPWQGDYEKIQNLNLEDSMFIAKKSFECDILSNFDFLHLDPSININNEDLSMDKILDRLFELYGHTYEFAKQNNKEIQFELGTEEQNGYGQDLDQFEYFLNETNKFCEKNNIKKPTFVVAQTGTKVMETKNIGVFSNENFHESNIIEHIKDVITICNKYNVLLKEHNTDYLNNEALALRPILGIHASNVAPEFGVIETRAFINILKTFGFKKEIDSFIEIAIESQKWSKWMLKDSKASDFEKAIICGHYIFSNKEIILLKERIQENLYMKNIDLDSYLKRLIKESMMKYLILFRMI